MNPIVVTFVTDPAHPGLERLKQSCSIWGWPVVVLTGPWRGWGGRLKLVLSQVPSLLAAGYTHLVHLDAYDVVATGSVLELGAALDLYGRPPVLLAAEPACWPPDEGVRERYEAQEGHWWYAHSQFVVDMTQPTPAALADVADGEDDQRHLHRVYLAPTPGVVIDRACRVVQSIAHCHPWGTFFEKRDGRLVNIHTLTRPLFFHGNGQTEMGWVTQ